MAYTRSRRYRRKAPKRKTTLAGRVVRAVKGRYAPRGRVNLTKIARDVMTLKSVINSEKKEFTFEVTTNSVGQLGSSGTGVTTDDGWMIQDSTPIPASGAGFNQRTGRSIKLHSMRISGQYRKLANAGQQISLNFYVIKVVGEPRTLDTSLVNDFLEVNPLTGLTDNNSPRNPQSMRDFKIYARKRLYLPADRYFSEGTPDSVKSFTLNIRLNHHIKFNADTTGVESGQMFVLVTASSGNVSSTAGASDPELSTVTAFTGANISYYTKVWYYDN